MGMKRKIYIRTVLLLSLMVGIITAAISLLTLTANRKWEKERILTQASFTAVQVERLHLWDDQVSMRKLLNDSISHDPVLSYAFINTGTGGIRIHTFEKGLPKGLVNGHLHGAPPLVRLIAMKGVGTFYDICVRIGPTDSFLHIGASRRSIDKAALPKIAATFAAAILVLLLLLWPAYSMAEAVTAEAEEAFGKLKEMNENLEEKVLERTAELSKANAELCRETLGRRYTDIILALSRLVEFSYDPSLDDLLEETLNEAEKLTGSLIGFYHFVDEDQQGLSLQNWSTRTKAKFCKAVGKGFHYPIAQAGVWADCVRQSKPIIHNDYRTVPHRKGLPPGHAEVIREMSVPVMRNGKIKAILGVGNKASDYDQEDLDAIARLADLAWSIAERKLTEGRALTEKARAETYLDLAGAIIVALEPDQTISLVNKEACRVLGYTQEELLGRNWFDIIIPPDRREEVKGIFDRIITGDLAPVEHFENEVLTKDGSRRFIAWTNTLARDASGKVFKVLSSGMDLTDRKRMELDLQRTDNELRKNVRLYRMLASINQAAARATDLKGLYKGLCESVVEKGSFKMAWIGLPDKDTGRLMPVYSGGDAGDYLQSLKIPLDEDSSPRAKGPSGTASTKGRISVCADIAEDPRMAPWREKALAMGYASSAAVPLMSPTGRLTAVLTLYSGEKNFFTDDQVFLLEAVRADSELALGVIVSEEKRGEAESALKRTAAHLSHVMETIPAVIFQMRRMGDAYVPVWVSGNVEAITGYDPSDMLSPEWFPAVTFKEEREMVVRDAARAFKEGIISHDFRIRHKDGRVIWLHAQLKGINEATGEIIGSWTDVTHLKEMSGTGPRPDRDDG